MKINISTPSCASSQVDTAPLKSEYTARRGLLRVALVIGLFALGSLACITLNQTVVFDQDGSGAGVVLLEMTLPRDLPDKTLTFKDPQKIAANLSEQGWENVSVVPVEPLHYKATAEYHFGVEAGQKTLKDILPGYTLTVETADNNYKYYTFEGKEDYSELESFWNQVQNDWATKGMKQEFDFADWGGSSDEQVVMSAEEVQALMKTYGPPSARLSVILPGQTPVDASQFWDNEDEFMAGKTDKVTFTWEPGKRAVAPLKIQRRLEPLTTVSAAEAQAQIDKLLALYENAIPAGSVQAPGILSGDVNNSLISFFNGENHTCAVYQGLVLAWLDTIRAGPDEATRNLLKGLDYGPIQTNGGGHRAVVLFQRGTDWRTTGVVLDPWPYQRPGTWGVGNWSVALWSFREAARNPEPDAEAGNLYPHLTGKTSSYPAIVVLQGDLARGLAKPTRILLVRSPVSVLVTLADGRKIGVQPDGAFVNDLPREANLYTFPKNGASGEAQWWLFLPETGFTVELAGTGAGDFHALLATPQGYLGFGPQPIQSGQTASFSAEASGQLSALTLPDTSTVPSQTIAPEELDAALGISTPASGTQPTSVAQAATAEPTQAAGSSTPSLQICGISFGGVVILGIAFSRGVLAGSLSRRRKT